MPGFYLDTIRNFIKTDENAIFSQLATAHLNDFTELNSKQEKSWKKLLRILNNALHVIKDLIPEDSGLILEYKIPRREKRIDCILLLGDFIIVVEFKAQGTSGKTQIEDYCYDLRDFHFMSKGKVIFPILLTSKSEQTLIDISLLDSPIQDIITADGRNLFRALINILQVSGNTFESINVREWNDSVYMPTPTIIEVVKSLYNNHKVDEITRHHAGVENLDTTTKAILEAINHARANNKKIICFVTGIPGAGKTLAGLNIAHSEEFQFDEYSLATFLSGNVPLINVLREALRRDVIKKYGRNEKERKRLEVERIDTFIEKVHTFIDTHYFKEHVEIKNKVIIFDEAQRAWDAKHNERKSEGKYNKSEPQILLEILDRHHDWCAIIALIGGGQEINTGESGLEEWGRTISKKFRHWKVYISPHLLGDNLHYAHKPLFTKKISGIQVETVDELHLSISLRSYKAEKLSDWINNVLELSNEQALDIFDNDLLEYPIFATRDLEKAKGFLRSKGIGTRRVGLIASSGGRRLRAHGIDVDAKVDEKYWFLNSSVDIRSSNFLELVGKDFKIQGLELDWTCVCWDADFFYDGTQWQYRNFSGTTWKKVRSLSQREYIKNKYRVLLSRAREGIILFVPSGDLVDGTRNKDFYDGTYQYLLSCGAKEL